MKRFRICERPGGDKAFTPDYRRPREDGGEPGGHFRHDCQRQGDLVAPIAGLQIKNGGLAAAHHAG
jgi:hypothetical protein